MLENLNASFTPLTLPLICNLESGLVVPIPTLPSVAKLTRLMFLYRIENGVSVISSPHVIKGL